MCNQSRSDLGDFIRLFLHKQVFLPFSHKLGEVTAEVMTGLFQRKAFRARGQCLCPSAPVTTTVPMGQGEQVWVMGLPAVSRCNVCPSQFQSQVTPLEVSVRCPSPGCTWLWPQKCLQPQNYQLWEELSPGQELLGAGDSATLLSKGCRARCRNRGRSASSASQSQQQLRSVCSSPGLWPGSPPHTCQHVVKSQPQPVAPRRNLRGFRNHKCQRGICRPRGPLDPSDQRRL